MSQNLGNHGLDGGTVFVLESNGREGGVNIKTEALEYKAEGLGFYTRFH